MKDLSWCCWRSIDSRSPAIFERGWSDRLHTAVRRSLFCYPRFIEGKNNLTEFSTWFYTL
ncbi:hypothetical protein QUA82_10350 [Microcoleus sp. F8-D3]